MVEKGEDTAGGLLDQIKNTDSVSYGREEACAIWREKKIALAVDGAQEVGKLEREGQYTVT